MALAGLAWGFVFVAPALAPGAGVLLLAAGRFSVFGLASLPQLRRVVAARPPWRRVAAHALAGSVLYYVLLVAAIRLSGPTVTVAVISLLPAVMAVLSARAERTGLLRLGPALASLVVGQLLVQAGDTGDSPLGADPVRLATGVLLALAALALWSWYGLDSHRLLRARPELAPLWSSTQGVVAGALALPVLVGTVVVQGTPPAWGRAVVVVLALGFLSSWLAVRLWNAASTVLPGSLTSQLLALETAAGFLLAATVAGRMPDGIALVGELLVVLGCVLALALAPARADDADEAREEGRGVAAVAVELLGVPLHTDDPGAVHVLGLDALDDAVQSPADRA